MGETQQVTEDALKQQVRERLSADFEIHEEVEGWSIVEQCAVRIDFMLHPRLHLIEQGFDLAWFGCEVKAPSGNEPHKKGMWLLWQAITYAQSSFAPLCDRPAFVVIYPDLHQFFPENKRLAAVNLQAFAQRGSVGRLLLDDDSWSIRFGSQRYFSSNRGRGKVKNLGLKRNVGTH